MKNNKRVLVGKVFFLGLILILSSSCSSELKGFYRSKKTNNYFYFQGKDTILIMSKHGSSIVSATYKQSGNSLCLVYNNDYSSTVIREDDDCEGLHLKLDKYCKATINNDTLHFKKNKPIFIPLTWQDDSLTIYGRFKSVNIDVPNKKGCYSMEVKIDESLFMTIDRELIKFMTLKRNKKIIVNGIKFKKLKR